MSKQKEEQTDKTENSLRTVMESNNKIKLMDSDHNSGLDIFCYTDCSNTDEDIVKQSRGMVFHKNTLVATSFPYADEYTNTDTGLETVFSNFKDWLFFESYEGSVLRLFHYSGNWFLATNKKLNAFQSYWSSRQSFGALFELALQAELERNPGFKEFLEKSNERAKADVKKEEKTETKASTKVELTLHRFQRCLNSDMQYIFLLRNTQDNRIVCRPPKDNEPLIYHIGTSSTSNPNIVYLDDDVRLEKPKRLMFSNLEDLTTYVKNIDYLTTQGVVCFDKLSGHISGLNTRTNTKHVKILNKNYQDLFNVRGNIPSVNFRYLQVRMDDKAKKTLTELYPLNVEMFQTYENVLYSIAKRLYNSYVKRYIDKEFVQLPVEEFIVNNTCHKMYLETKVNTSLETVISVLNKQDPSSLNKMIKNALFAR